MGRLILLALAVLALVWLARRALRSRQAPPDTPAAPAELVACAHCGVLLPRAEARAPGAADAGLHYCSDEHARLGPRRP
jgi:uncharacterized protein